MLKANNISQFLNIVDTGAVYELQIIKETGGDRTRGIPSQKTVKRVKLVSSQLLKRVREEWISTGIARSGDVTLVTAEQLTMSNQIEHDGIKYDIVEQIDSTTYIGKYFVYILRRVLS